METHLDGFSLIADFIHTLSLMIISHDPQEGIESDAASVVPVQRRSELRPAT